jgi:CDP-glycerol glycerophosphotransferase (TagB/SpsB family)
MKVLFFTYGGAHVQLTMKLAKELLSRNHEIEIIGLTTAAAVLLKEGLTPHKITQFVDSHDPIVREFGSQLLVEHHTEGKGISKEESIAYLGNGFKELVEEYGELGAYNKYKDYGLNAFLPKKVCKKIINFFEPDLVFATDSPRMERAALNAAYEMGIKSVCAIVIFPHIGMHYLKRRDNGDVVLVLNCKIKDQLVKAGRNPDQIYVTGNPGFDNLYIKNVKGQRKKLRDKYGIPEDEKVVLWAEQPEPSNPALPRAVRHQISRFCENRPGFKAMVRLHPASSDEANEKVLPSVLLSPSRQTILDALLISDIVVTLTSTVGYEALLLNKPLIVIDISEFRKYVDYSDRDGALVISSREKLSDAILMLADGRNKLARYLEKNRNKLPEVGNAAARIVDIIEKKKQ